MQANKTNRIYTFLLCNTNLEEGKNVEKRKQKKRYIWKTQNKIDLIPKV